MRHVLITGANGFVGAALCEWLAKAEWRVSALVRSNASKRLLDYRRLPEESVRVIEVDYSDDAALRKHCKGVDAVVHCAGLTKAFTEADYRTANVELTERLIAAQIEAAPEARFVFISSLAAVGDSPEGEALTENVLPHPVSQYGKSKQAAEEAVKRRAKLWTIIRPASVYGPGDSDFYFMFQSVKRHVIPVAGAQGRRFSVIHVDDLCAHIETCLTHPNALHETFFATDAFAPTLHQFLFAMQLAVGSPAVQIRIPAKQALAAAFISEMVGRMRGKVPLLNRERALEFTGGDFTCSPDKSKELLGFAVQRDLREALTETAEWYRNHGWL